MELAAACSGTGALDVCDDLGDGGGAGARERFGGEADWLVGTGEEGFDGGGLGGDGGEGAFLCWTVGARVCGCWDGLGAFSRHGGRCLGVSLSRRVCDEFDSFTSRPQYGPGDARELSWEAMTQNAIEDVSVTALICGAVSVGEMVMRFK